MPNITFIKERRERVRATPADLFHRFYAAFGFILTISMFAACFISVRSYPTYLPALLGATAGIVPGWGLFYGAWVKRLAGAFCLLTLIAIVSSLALGFALMGQPPLMAGAFGTAGGTCLAWLAMTGAKIGMWPNQ